MPNDFYEQTVEDIIFDNRTIIHRYGLPVFKKTTFRQFYLPSGKKIDIISYDLTDGHIKIDVYELKRLTINADAICQAYNYFIELTSVTAGKFKSVDIHIIMVGRAYEPMLLFEKMNLPFSVYTYDYRLTGMIFSKHQERLHPKTVDDDFCMGLWAFGLNELSFPNGQGNTVNVRDIYRKFRSENEVFHKTILSKTGSLFTQPSIIEVPVIKYLSPSTIETEIFPKQPDWTPEFARSIPPDEYMFDLEIDESDYEPEPIENDTSDFEAEIEEEDYQDATTLTIEEREQLFKVMEMPSESEENQQIA